MSHEFRCSFCGKTNKEVDKLISGPHVFICDKCVSLCVDVLAEIPNAVEKATENMAKSIGRGRETEALRGELNKTRQALNESNRKLSAIIDVIGTTSTRCYWCGLVLPSNPDEIRAHSATCERHPAVVRLAEASAT